MVKLLMSWDIKPGRESEYFEFVVREYAPSMIRLGIPPTEAWYTIYGEGPQMLTGAVADDMETMMGILNGDDWSKLRASLMEFVTNFKQKLVRATGRFQLM